MCYVPGCTSKTDSFQILCAVLNKYYSFVHPFSPLWTFWYIREASTAILVANMPMCWALMRRLFNLRSFHSSTSVTLKVSAPHIGMIASRKDPGLGLQGTQTSTRENRGDVSWWERDQELSRLGRTESEEYIMMPAKTKASPLEVWETKDFDVVNDRGSLTGSLREDRSKIYDELSNQGKDFQTKTKVTATRRSESSSFL